MEASERPELEEAARWEEAARGSNPDVSRAFTVLARKGWPACARYALALEAELAAVREREGRLREAGKDCLTALAGFHGFLEGLCGAPTPEEMPWFFEAMEKMREALSARALLAEGETK